MAGYQEVQPWLNDMARLIRNDYDNLNLITGREGRGKSTWIRKVARKLDPAFSVAHIHFNQEDFFRDAVSLPPGRAVVLDEFRGHRRLAMHGDRMEFLDFAKECRGLRLHIFIAFNRATAIDRDLLTDRISYWHHIRKRGLVEIRKPTTELMFDKDGQPIEKTYYPLVGVFPFTDKGDPLKSEYLTKKDARMRDRAARFQEAHGTPATLEEEPKARPAVHPAILAMVQKELGRAP